MSIREEKAREKTKRIRGRRQTDRQIRSWHSRYNEVKKNVLKNGGNFEKKKKTKINSSHVRG